MSETGAPTLFAFDNNYDNHEQVRPYMADFLTVYAEITADGGFPYNDSFKGRIPGLADSTDKDEDTGIYLLQNLRRLDREQARREEFLASGGVVIAETVDDFTRKTRRGTLVHYGFYMGGTGWNEYPDARVTVDDQGRVLFKEPRQRSWRTMSGGGFLFRPSS